MSRYLFWTLLYTGCSSYPVSSTEEGERGTGGATNADSGWDTASDGAADMDEATDQESSYPEWFALDGEIQVVGGEAQAISLQMRTYGENPSDGVLEGCDVRLSVNTFTAEATTPDPMITHWWSLGDVSIVEPWECGEQSQLPTSGIIGLGSFHPELNGRVLQLDLSEPSTSLYGFYASLDYEQPPDGFDTGGAYIVGYGLTESTLSGVEDVSLDGPLPDGLYQLVGVFLLPLAP